jgi:pimeloyl-ACP methyl ester carboxylesterase
MPVWFQSALLMPFVDVSGARLEYRHTRGRTGRPTLVFLHQGLGAARSWRKVAPALAARTGCGTLVYSRRGYGKSSPFDGPFTPRLLHDEALAVLPAILRARGVTDPLLVGHSDGAGIALIYAGAPVGHVTALVLEAPHVFVEPETLDSVRGIKDEYRTTTLRDRLDRVHGRKTAALVDAWATLWTSPDSRDWNIEEYVRRVSCPVLVIQGADDEYGTLKQVDAIRRAASGPVEALVLPACGHEPHREHPELVLDAMTAFVLRVL